MTGIDLGMNEKAKMDKLYQEYLSKVDELKNKYLVRQI